MNLKYKKVGIVAKPHEDVVLYLKRTIEYLEKLGVEIFLEKIAAELIGCQSTIPRQKIPAISDVIILIGGDGTFLSIAAEAVENDKPVAGFNLGTLGFLTELKKERLEEHLSEILQGKMQISERKLLECRFNEAHCTALNDVVVTKGKIARIIKLSLEIDGMHVAEIKADGLIISTPTGSTAYSISAGGPIVTPQVNGIVVTPICPHSLTFRPFVVPGNSKIKVKLISENPDVFITIDGQEVYPIKMDEVFETTIYPKTLKMIVSEKLNYFKLLHEKLNWGL